MKNKNGKISKNTNADSSALDCYLRELHRIPLLRKEEELEIAKLAANGDKAAGEKPPAQTDKIPRDNRAIVSLCFSLPMGRNAISAASGMSRNH